MLSLFYPLRYLDTLTISRPVLPYTDMPVYKAKVSENTFDIETIRQLESLSKSLGGLTECKRLGFVYEDDKGPVLVVRRVGLPMIESTGFF